MQKIDLQNRFWKQISFSTMVLSQVTKILTVPTITAEFTQRVEALILRRVKDRAWDDVERKTTVAENMRVKIKPVNAEKSKLGLAEVYEQSYIKAANKVFFSNFIFNNIFIYVHIQLFFCSGSPSLGVFFRVE